MVKTLIVSDTKDSILGGFFESCKQEVDTILDSNKFEKKIIDGNKAFEVLLPLKVKNFNSKPFLFVNFSHGIEDKLLQNASNEFLSLTINIECTQNAFVYCYACKAGKVLGKEICNDETLCFIGYEEDVIIQEFFNAKDAFVDCATFGLRSFVNGSTSKQVFNSIKEKHTKYIDEFYIRDMLTASLFMQNRDALCIYGNLNLSITDL